MNRRIPSTDPYRNLRGKNILVIGGTSGIGKACVNLFAQHGSNVGFTYLQSQRVASELVRRLHGLDGTVRAWRVDLESDASLRRFSSSVSRELGHLEALVMCQGTIEGKRLCDYSFRAIERVFGVNIFSVMKLSKLLRGLLTKGSAMTLISSISAQAGSYDPVYASSKGAVLSFTKAVSREFGPDVRVNAVAPALTRGTGMFESMDGRIRRSHLAATALERLATPADIANAVLFLSTDASRHITGACIDVNGGEYFR